MRRPLHHIASPTSRPLRRYFDWIRQYVRFSRVTDKSRRDRGDTGSLVLALLYFLLASLICFTCLWSSASQWDRLAQDVATGYETLDVERGAELSQPGLTLGWSLMLVGRRGRKQCPVDSSITRALPPALSHHHAQLCEACSARY